MSAVMKPAEAMDGEVIPPACHTPSAEAEAMAPDIIAAHDELIEGMWTTVDTAVVVGRLLLQAKRRWRGEWLIWLERNTPIKRRTAVFYMELATAREKIGGGRNWKRISNLGVTGAVRELRAKLRKSAAAAKRLDPMTGSAIVTVPAPVPQILPHHGAHLTELLLHTVHTYSASKPELTSDDALEALNRVSTAIRDRGLDASPPERGA
jgi:hypothetical protein